MVPFHVFAATHPRFTCPLPSTCVCRQPRLPAPTGSGPRPCRGASRDLRFLLVRVDSRLSIFNRVSFFFPQVILAERSTNLFRIRTYEKFSCKSFRIRTYKNPGGGAVIVNKTAHERRPFQALRLEGQPANHSHSKA